MKETLGDNRPAIVAASLGLVAAVYLSGCSTETPPPTYDACPDSWGSIDDASAYEVSLDSPKATELAGRFAVGVVCGIIDNASGQISHGRSPRDSSGAETYRYGISDTKHPEQRQAFMEVTPTSDGVGRLYAEISVGAGFAREFVSVSGALNADVPKKLQTVGDFVAVLEPDNFVLDSVTFQDGKKLNGFVNDSTLGGVESQLIGRDGKRMPGPTRLSEVVVPAGRVVQKLGDASQ